MNPSEPMSDDNDGCISAGDIKPSGCQYRVEYTHGHKSLKCGDVVIMVETTPDHRNLLLKQSNYTLHPLMGEHDQYVHLSPVSAMPAPPKPERTQAEEDDEKFKKLFPSACYIAHPSLGNSFYVSSVWHAALAYRDAQNRADLANIGQYSSAFDTSAHVVALFNLRKRCGLR